MEQQKARSRQRNGLGIALVGRLGSHSQRRIQATRLSVLIGRMQWTCLWMLQNADEAKMQTRCHRMFVGMLRTGFGLVNIDDMCLRPFRARIFSRWLSRLSVGLSVFSPEISETAGFRWYIHASDFPPKSQTWWDFEPAKMGSKMLQVLHVESDVLKGYRSFGGAISVYSVSCMSNVIFNPSLLNWSSLILTMAHMTMISPLAKNQGYSA